LVITFDLPFIRFTKTDDVNRISPRGEHHDMQPIPYVPQCPIPILAIIESIVFYQQGRRPVKVHHQGEWESTLFNVASILGYVISNLHDINVPTIISLHKARKGVALYRDGWRSGTAPKVALLVPELQA
jgi:hypothetical protein